MKKEIFFYILGFLVLVSASNTGNEVEWDDAPYMVKVFSRHSTDKNEKPGPVKSCTGSLISPALVLTNIECVRNHTTKEYLEEIVISYHQYGARQQTRVLGKLIEKSSDWALIKIKPIDVKLLCPSEIDREKRIARLNIKPSLTKDMRVALTFDAVKNLKCWMNGFTTTGKSQDFIQKSNLLQVQLTEFLQDPRNPNRLVYNVDNTSIACIEDLGTALICQYHNDNFQVGFLRTLQAYPSALQAAKEIENPQQRNLAICAATAKIVFTEIYDDNALLSAIEKYDLGGFVDAYFNCGFTQ